MKRTTAAIVLIVLAASLVLPGAALAKGGSGGTRGKSAVAHEKAARGPHGETDASAGAEAPEATPTAESPELESDEPGPEAEKSARKAARSAAKVQRKEAREAGQTARKASRSVDASGDVDSQPDSDEPTGTSPRAFSSITANIERALEMVAGGSKTRVPPGLLRVWYKFAGWLGVDPSTAPAPLPGVPVGPPGETTVTVEPTGTVNPPTTDPLAPPVDPTATPAL